MENFTITELFTSYLLKRGRNLMHPSIYPFLLDFIVIEMDLDGNIMIDNDYNMLTTDKVPVNAYSKVLYDLIREKNRKVSLRAFLGVITADGTYFNAIVPLEDGLQAKGMVRLTNTRNWLNWRKVTFFHNALFDWHFQALKRNFFNSSESLDLILFVSAVNRLFVFKKLFIGAEKRMYREKRKELFSKSKRLSRIMSIAQGTYMSKTLVTARTYTEY